MIPKIPTLSSVSFFLSIRCFAFGVINRRRALDALLPRVRYLHVTDFHVICTSSCYNHSHILRQLVVLAIMPGLRRSDYSYLDYPCDQDDPIRTRPPLPTASASRSTSAQNRTHQHNVRYIPSQMDSLSSTTTEAARESPFRLFIQDAGVLIKMLRYLPWIFLPFRTDNQDAELYLGLANLRDNALQVVLFSLESLFLLLAIPVIVVLPGSLIIAVAAGCCFLVLALTKPIQGPSITYSRMDGETTASAKRHEDERWLFVNGCSTAYVYHYGAKPTTNAR